MTICTKVKEYETFWRVLHGMCVLTSVTSILFVSHFSLSPAGSVLVCRLCNLFSPSLSQLLAHCSKTHPQHEPPDSIITTLQPLMAEPVEELAGTSATECYLTATPFNQ